MNKRVTISALFGAASLLAAAVLVPNAQGAINAPTVGGDFSCTVAAWPAWSNCVDDNYVVMPGRHVYIAVKSSDGVGVAFRVLNKNGGQILANAQPRQAPDGTFHFYWTNDTAYAMTISIQADANSATAVTVEAAVDVRLVKSNI